MIAAIILAAGAGRRIGTPKALLRRGDETYLSRAVDVCRRAGCRTVWATTREDLPELDEEVARLGLVPVLNKEPEDGMFSSVKQGLIVALAEDPDSEFFVLYPVDHPEVKSETVLLLVESLRKQLAKDANAAWSRPAFEGRGGHPIVVTSDMAQALAADPDNKRPLRDALFEMAEPLTVEVDDSGVRKNVNTPEDL